MKKELEQLTKKNPEKNLLVSLKKRAGRAKTGRITVRHRGGGAKRLYRIVDFGQQRIGQKAEVIALEYDPYRTAFICLLQYPDKAKRYRLAAQGMMVGDEVIIAENEDIKSGNRIKLKNIPIGTIVFNIELQPGKGGIMARSAGCGVKVLAHEAGFSHLEMPSKELRKVPQECFATVGVVSRAEHRYRKLGKAGLSRWKGKRPTVRGSAMAPADHPHGGGEGRAGIGLKHPKTPWGKPAHGVKTRRKKRSDKHILRRRIKKKK